MAPGLEEKLDKILGDEYNVSCYDDDSCDVEFWSPAGEDFPVGLNGKNLRELADCAKKAYEAFDCDEHAAQIYHAKHYGSENDKRFYAGAPEYLHDLLEDAESIKESYRDIWEKLEAAANAETTTQDIGTISGGEMQERRLVRIGRTNVKNALGFFWFDKTKIYVARNMKDLEEFEDRGHSKKKFHPMCEIEQAYRDSSALRFISWCDTGCIVRQGARQVTFDYNTAKVIMHIR